MLEAQAFAVSESCDTPRKGIRGDNSELVSDFWIMRVVDTDLLSGKTPRASSYDFFSFERHT